MSAAVTDPSKTAAFFGIFHVQSTRCHVNVQRKVVFRALSGLKRLKFTLRLSCPPVFLSFYLSGSLFMSACAISAHVSLFVCLSVCLYSCRLSLCSVYCYSCLSLRWPGQRPFQTVPDISLPF